MPFQDFIGQEQIIKLLRKSLAEDTLNHALLFTGPAGTGKETLAFLLAQAVNCREEEKPPCGKCLSCRKTMSLNHPDVRLIIKEGTGIRINQIRALKQESLSQPYEGRKKVVIIRDAEDMSLAAANSFLKTLEEPPPYMVFILLSGRPQALLPTIKSRCRIFPFQPVSEKIITAYLVKKRTLLPGEARVFAALARGKAGLAVALSEDEDFYALRERAYSFVKGLRKLAKKEIFLLAEELAKEKESALFLDLCLEILRDMFLYRETGKEDYVTNIDYLEFYQNDRYWRQHSILTAINSLVKAKEDLGALVNPKLALGVLLLELKEVI